MLPLLLAPALLAAPPDAAALKAAFDEYNSGAAYPLPSLTGEQLSRLQREGVIRYLRAADGEPHMAFGALLAELDRDRLWVACQDLHYVTVPEVYEQRLALDDRGDAIWFGYVDMPFPFQDRAYTVDVWNTHALAAASEGRSWEHGWRLRPEGLIEARALAAEGTLGAVSAEQIDDAIQIPFSQGAWAVLTVSETWSLLVHHSAASIGGAIPARVVSELALVGMERLLRRVEVRARDEIAGHYVVGHEPLAGGDGQPVPPW